MFIFNPDIKNLDIEVEEIVNLFRSANDMQVALPGHSSQRSSGFLCCYKVEEKLEVVAVSSFRKKTNSVFTPGTRGAFSPRKSGRSLKKVSVFF